MTLESDTKPNIFTMGADQFDDFEPKEKAQKLSFFNWLMFGIFYEALFSNTFLIYIQDNVGWTVGYSLPTLGLGVSIVVFFVDTPYYRHKATSESPLTSIARVLVAVMRRRKEVVPNDLIELYEVNLDQYNSSGKCMNLDSHTFDGLHSSGGNSDGVSVFGHGRAEGEAEVAPNLEDAVVKLADVDKAQRVSLSEVASGGSLSWQNASVVAETVESFGNSNSNEGFDKMVI
ncbi:Protein NRT1/ PTR FAMILY 5.2 [Camellia lanceoleosa]|uniref:Protein NRT1/ PTR FAMILY 5.2 n=1 Tax=Camellia lanceoleosa TaxID=1840588 RepID=A0ACC0HM71_9ERIC|nr:Protein NRT1/ PTR FAMILY 5.2 [Camellia lanceoleosa]